MTKFLSIAAVSMFTLSAPLAAQNTTDHMASGDHMKAGDHMASGDRMALGDHMKSGKMAHHTTKKAKTSHSGAMAH